MRAIVHTPSRASGTRIPTREHARCRQGVSAESEVCASAADVRGISCFCEEPKMHAVCDMEHATTCDIT